MKPDPEVFRKILLNAHQALQRGERHAARRWAERAVELVPDSEDAWLILAAVASPRASINYLQKALEINPNSQRAQRGMQWALERLGRQPSGTPAASSLVVEPGKQPQAWPAGQALLLQEVDRPVPVAKPVPHRSWNKYRWSFLTLFLIAVCVTAAWAFWPGSASPVQAFLRAPHSTPGIMGVLADVIRPSDTPSPSPTFTLPPTETFTPFPNSTDTLLPTDTATPTDTPLPTDTATPLPTDTQIPPPTDTLIPTLTIPVAPAVSSASGGVRWIDVDLSKQMLYAYEGNTVVKSFLVSTGVRAHPTVTGKFHIYVKYLYTLMHGDGYYLPNVPYTMYFYKSYGIHGTYWHHNFGHPMSHGCVNMYTPDAQWMYYWASIGTLVNVHY
jgi:lipoprotein-anchoring transpeptidase ErfK/SrfK